MACPALIKIPMGHDFCVTINTLGYDVTKLVCMYIFHFPLLKKLFHFLGL